jgi:hypothetical protein
MRSLGLRLSALATILLGLAIVAVLTLRAMGAPLALGPATTAVASPSPTSSATASASQDALHVFGEIEDEVSALRELPPADIGPPDVISRAQLADELEEVFDETWTEEQLAADNLTLRAMGLLAEEQDIRQLTESLYADQVLGFYDFEARRMVVVTDAGLTEEAKITYAHEFTHAMQDAAFDTGAERERQADDDDPALARLALEEGDATLAMVRWALDGNLSPDEMAGIGATPIPDMSAIPPWMVRQLTFPYESGATFVTQLWAAGGWDAVDAAYDQPPASTEQVLHPEKYLAGEVPLNVPEPDVAGRLGAGWRQVEATTIGEAMVGIWLEQLGADRDEADAAALGWGGDELSVARGPDGTWAMAWQLEWDAPVHATEFLDLYQQLRGALPFATDVQSSGNTGVTVVHASSADLVDEVLAGS